MYLYNFRRYFLFFSLFLVYFNNFLIAQQKDQRPNIIYIMADDMGYADLSCYGRKEYQTPNLDKLASQGVKFMNAYAAAPVCTPTRVAFMTGKYPARTEIGLLEPWIPIKKDTAIGLAAAKTSLPALVKNAGYETALIGKWHLGVLPRFSPLQNGFDYFYGIKVGAADYISHKADGGRYGLYENDTLVYPTGYMTELISGKAMQFLKQPHTKPFFLSLQFTAPHWPWQGPEDKPLPDTIPMNVTTMSVNGTPAIYQAMMKSLDDQIGRIMQVLDETGLTGNTIVIFTSDNGGEEFSDMGIYKGKKMDLWEGGIREPAFVKWPGKIKENSTTFQVATTMDWTATILSLAGANSLQSLSLDGIDLIPIITGKEKEKDRELYWRTFQRKQQKALRDGKWKYLQDEKGEEYLFDLAIDPSEKNDLKEKEKKVFENLKKKYALWETTVLKPIALK
jgi:arylsulfatase A-like enzyme